MTQENDNTANEALRKAKDYSPLSAQSPRYEPSELVRILKKPSKMRTDEEIHIIGKATEKFPFFQKYLTKKKYKDFDLHAKCCKEITHEFHRQGHTVFHEGDEGDKLYVILSGRVNIYVKMSKEERKKVMASEEEQKFVAGLVQESLQHSQKVSLNIIKNNIEVADQQFSSFRQAVEAEAELESHTLITQSQIPIIKIEMTENTQKNIPEEEPKAPSSGRIPSAEKIRSTGRIPSAEKIRSTGRIPSAEKIPSTGKIPSVGRIPSSGNLQVPQLTVPSQQSLDGSKRNSLRVPVPQEETPQSARLKPRPSLKIIKKNTRGNSMVNLKTGESAENRSPKIKKSTGNVLPAEVDPAINPNEEAPVLTEAAIQEQKIMKKAADGQKYLGTIGPGGIFGEVALTTGKRRLASIIVTEDCHFGVLSKDSFNRLLGPLERQKFGRRMDFFEMVFGLKLGWEKAVKLMYMFDKIQVPLGKNLFEDQGEADGLYVVKSGNFLLYKEIEFPDNLKGLQEKLVEEVTGTPRHPLQGKLPIKKGKFPVQMLTAGDFLGEEALFNHKIRQYTVQCKSDSAVVYHIPHWKLQTLLWHMKDMLQLIFHRLQERIQWRNQRYNERNKFIENIIKTSHNLTTLNAEKKAAPYIRRMFAHDVPSAFAVVNKEPKPLPEFKPNTYSGKKNKKTAFFAAVEEALNVVGSPNRKAFQKRTRHITEPCGDSVSMFQYVNKVNAEILTGFGEEEVDLELDPARALKKMRLDLNPDDWAASARNYQIMLKARLEKFQSRTLSPSSRKEVKLKGCKTLKEACARVGPVLKKVGKSSSKMVLESEKSQEEFRDKVAKSMNSARSSIKSTRSKLLLMKIQGLETNREKSPQDLKSERSTLASNYAKKLGREIGQSQGQEREYRSFRLSRAENTSSVTTESGYKSMLAHRQSAGLITSRDLSSFQQEIMARSSVVIVKETSQHQQNNHNMMTPEVKRSSRRNISSPSLVRVLNLQPANHSSEKKRTAVASEMGIASQMLNSSRPHSREKDGKEKTDKEVKPYLSIFNKRIATPEKRRERLPSMEFMLDYQKTNHKGEVSVSVESLQEIVADLEEKKVAVEAKDKEKEGSRETSPEKLMRKTGHNMFRMGLKRTSRNRSQNEEKLSHMRNASL